MEKAIKDFRQKLPIEPLIPKVKYCMWQKMSKLFYFLLFKLIWTQGTWAKHFYVEVQGFTDIYRNIKNIA